MNPEQFASAFGEVVNMVEAGADPNGKQDVVPVIERELSNDTLLYFPPGTYKMNSQVARRGGRNIGIIGKNAVLTHGTVEDIEGFEVTEGEFSGKAQHFKIGSSDSLHHGKFVFGGFTADWRGENTGMQILNHQTTGTSEIRAVKQVGMHDLGCQGPMRLNPATDDAKIRAQNLDFRAGGQTYQKTINERNADPYGNAGWGRSWATTGIADHPHMHGLLRVENAYVGGWPDNGIYTVGGGQSKAGTVEIVNCVVANSHPSNIRIGGVNSKIKGCTVIVNKQFGKYYFEQRPVRLDHGSCSVEDTRIIQKNPTGWSLTVLHGVTRARLKNLRITIHDQPTPALIISPGADRVRVQDVSIQTPGWQAMEPLLIQSGGAKMSNIRIDGEKIT
ncbi:hypothetical protein DMJ13_25975 [halophilic archaeon]|nr:hypothetical protein DMJ13_25975 [halophilic archaeon]